jgi:hypothetical protein
MLNFNPLFYLLEELEVEGWKKKEQRGIIQRKTKKDSWWTYLTPDQITLSTLS